MMGDIYRAWLKKDKRMIIHEQDFIPLKVTNIGVFRLCATCEESHWVLQPEDCCDITKSIGLKDKNDVEIFFGDIVNYGKFALNDERFGGPGQMPEGIDEMEITTVIKTFEVKGGYADMLEIQQAIEINPDVVGIEVVGNKYEGLK